jgi:meiosis arrest female protein 1
MASSAPETSDKRLIGIFWDIENCSVPHGKSAARVVDKIRAMHFMEDRREMEFLVVCDVFKISQEISDELNSVQVQLQHVSSARKKNAADEKLRQAMRKFVDTFAPECPDLAVVLISGDVDFVADLSDFKRRRAGS